jgi:GT2 family glycosyltransferase
MATEQSHLASVITLTHNRKEQLRNLLDALRAQDYRPFEVIVIDNASSDGTEGLVRTHFPEVRLLQTQKNLGNYAYNYGISEAKGEYLCMIDDDGLPARKDWITQLVRRFEANPRLGAAACTIRMQDTGRIAADSPQFAPDGDGALGYPCAAYNGTGVGLRSAAIKPLVPIYPKYYFRTYIELYLCTRLLQAGWDVRVFPEIEVWHCRATGTSDPPLAYYGLRNYYWYVWALYPWPETFTETLHELGSRIKLTVQGKVPVSLFFAALRDAISDLGDAIAARQPVSRDIVKQLRRIRRHGNWHGIVPEVVSFSDAGGDERTWNA